MSSCLCQVCLPIRRFFLNSSPTTEIYTLSLHDALPIYLGVDVLAAAVHGQAHAPGRVLPQLVAHPLLTPKKQLNSLVRSEEHTSELQSQSNLVCRLLLEKKNER